MCLRIMLGFDDFVSRDMIIFEHVLEGHYEVFSCGMCARMSAERLQYLNTMPVLCLSLFVS